MRVGFYLDVETPQYLRMLSLAVEAVKHAMPDAEPLRLPSVNAVPYTWARAKAQSQEPRPTLFLDVDCIVRKDVSEVWREDFDVALPEVADPFVRYTGAVVFCRSVEFWKRWLNDGIWGWGGDPTNLREFLQAFTRHVDTFPGKVLRLPQWKYEALPKNRADTCPDASIVHYRGPRKAWIPGL